MLINRNITVDGHRTSIRLEPEFWAGLADIAQREYLTIDQLCSEIDRGAGKLSRTAAIRIFITSYLARAKAQPLAQPAPPLAPEMADAGADAVSPRLQRQFVAN